MSHPVSTSRGVALSIVAAAIGAIFLVPYEAAVARADRGSAVAHMLLCAAIFNTVVAVWRERPLLRLTRIGWVAALFLTAATLVGNVAIAVSLPQIGSGMTSVVLKSQVVLTPLLAWATIGERTTRDLIVGVLGASAGFFVMRYGAMDGPAFFPVWALLAALAFAAMQVGTRWFVARIPVATVNALRLWIATAVVFALPTEFGGGSFSADRDLWLFAGTAGVLGPGLSRLGLMYAARHVTASLTALVGLIGPVFAFLLAYVAFGDVPTLAEIAGSCLVLAGVAWPVVRDLRSG